MVLCKMLHPAFSSCEEVLNPTNPYSRCQLDTQIASEREREREKRLHASFKVGHRALTTITKNNMQHSQRGLQNLAVTHNFSSTAGRPF